MNKSQLVVSLTRPPAKPATVVVSAGYHCSMEHNSRAVSNATLTNIEGHQADDADLTITINRSDLEAVMMGATRFSDQIVAGKARLEDDESVFEQLVSTLVQFELGFEIMPGTKAPPQADLNPLQQPLPNVQGE